MMARLGIAVIGQAPRDDIARTFAEKLPATTRIVLRGCLDGLGQAQVDALAPRDGEMFNNAQGIANSLLSVPKTPSKERMAYWI